MVVSRFWSTGIDYYRSEEAAEGLAELSCLDSWMKHRDRETETGLHIHQIHKAAHAPCSVS